MIGVVFDDEAVGVVPEPIDGGGGEQAIGGEGVAPFLEILVGHNGGGLFVALGDQGVEDLVGRWSQGF